MEQASRALQTHLICDVDVHVLTEGIALGEPCGTILDQVEGFQRPEGCQQFLHLQEANNASGFGQTEGWLARGQRIYLVVIQVVGQAPDEQFVGRVWDYSGHNA